MQVFPLAPTRQHELLSIFLIWKISKMSALKVDNEVGTDGLSLLWVYRNTVYVLLHTSVDIFWQRQNVFQDMRACVLSHVVSRVQKEIPREGYLALRGGFFYRC